MNRPPIVPPRSRPHGERRLLEHMKENQAGFALDIVSTRINSLVGSPDTADLQTTFAPAFQSLIQNNAGGDDDGTMVTCALGVSNADPLVPAQLPTPQTVIVRVRFGVGGGFHNAFVTVRQGVQFSVPATSFQLDAASFIDAIVPGVARAIGTLNYGTRPGFFENPTFDLYRAAAAPSVSTCVVPPFARNVSILASDPLMLSGGAGTTLTIVQGNVVASVVVNSLTDPNRLRGVPLPYDPISISLFNGSGTAGTYFITFHLGL